MTALVSKIRRRARKALRRGIPFLPWRMRPLILMYHCVDVDSFDPWGLSVTPEKFEAQAAWLAQNRNVLPLAEFAQRHSAGTLPANATAITFDDGYASFADTAAPILERHGLPATVFLPAAIIGRRQEFWWDQLAGLILDFEGERLTVSGKTVELGPRRSDEREWRPQARPATPRQALFRDTWAAIRTKPLQEIDRILDEIQGDRAEAKRSRTKPLMTPDQARFANGGLMEVGSHALTHPSLPSLSSQEKRREIFDSMERCKDLTGRYPRTFAYPFGDFDDEARTLVEECGFVCGCTTEPTPVSPGMPLTRLPRVAVGNWDGSEMKRRLLEI